MLPKKISNRYNLYKQVKLLGQGPSAKGIYIDIKNNNKVFIKVSTNKKLLHKEYIYQKLFYELSKKLVVKDVIIPKPLEIIEAGDYIAFVMEYFLAKSIIDAKIKTRLDAYIKVLKFLEQINTVNYSRKNYGLGQKSVAHQIITSPYFLSKNLMLYFSYTPLFIRSIISVIKTSTKWGKIKSKWLCHGDINVSNLLLLNKKVILLDFARASISHRYYDISRALNSTWYQNDFHEKLWSHIVRQVGFSKQQQKILKSFVILNLTERLSQRYKNPKQEFFYIKQLGTLLKTL